MGYSVKQAISHIQGLSGMKHLEEKNYCEEEGLAHGPIQEFARNRKSLKPTQLRKVFTELILIERELNKSKVEDLANAKKEFPKAKLLRVLPQLAYASGRELIPQDFYKLMTVCINKVEDEKDFRQFMQYIRAVMAYHKYETKFGSRKGGSNG